MTLQEIEEVPGGAGEYLCSASSEKFRQMLVQLYTLPEVARAEVHRRLIAIPYRDFLRSWYWDACRSEEVSRADYRCRRCGAQRVRLQVHHVRYEHHGFEHKHIEILRAICEACHKRSHQMGPNREILEVLGMVPEWVQPPPSANEKPREDLRMLSTAKFMERVGL